MVRKSLPQNFIGLARGVDDRYPRWGAVAPAVAWVFEDKDRIVAGEAGQRRRPVGGLASIAVKHQPDVLRHRCFARVSNNLAFVYPRIQFIGYLEVRGEIEQFSLYRGAAEKEDYRC